MTLEVEQNVGATRPNQRPNEKSRSWRQHGDPTNTRASNETHDQRFGAIVGGVTGRDRRRTDGGSGFAEMRVANFACTRLEIPPRLDVGDRPGKRNPERLRELGGEIELGHGILAKTVVDAVGRETKAASPRHDSERVEKRARVGAPGASDEHEFSLVRERVLADGTIDERHKRGSM